MGSSVYRRAAPDPLPVEPYFQKLPGSEAFLRAVAEEPLEDLHRLALADWLDEHGQAPRAAFIRAQCQMERFPAGHAARSILDHQANDLLRRHGKEWAAGLPGGSRRAEATNFHRGMLEGLSIDLSRARPRCEPLFRTADVRRLGLTLTSGEPLRRFLEAPWLPNLTHLEFDLSWSQPVANDDLEALAHCPRVRGLVSLRLSRPWVSGQFPPLSRMFLLPHLRRLDVWGYALDEPTAGALAGHIVTIPLRELRLNGVTPPALRALTHAPLAGLHALAISSMALRSSDFEELARSESLPGLRELSLRHTPFAVKAMKALIGWPLLSGLSCLRLGGTALTGDAVRLLARSPAVASLRVLDLDPNNYIRERGILALAESPYLSNLESLTLPYLGLHPRAAGVLLRSGVLGNLTALSLRRCGGRQFGGDLLASEHLGKLAFLDVRENGLTRKVKAAVRERWPFALV
jgi:uncharacterized protein (TIGR02996 family)